MAITFEEYRAARMRGKNPEEAYRPVSGGFSLGETVKNIPGSAGRFLGGIAGAVTHPVRTVKALAGVGAGAVEKLIPGEQAEEKYIDGLVDVYKQRYGGLDETLKTIENDPIGVLADLSTVLTGGAAIAGKIGSVSKLGTASKVAGTTSAIGEAVNPLSVVTKVGAPLKSLFPKLASTLEKSNWRLTKTKEGALLSQASDEAVDAASLVTKNILNETADFMAKQKIVGSPLQRFAKVTEKYNQTEDILDKFFGSFSKSAPGIDGNAYIRSLNGLKGAYKGHRDYNSITRQIDGAVNTVKGIMDKKGRMDYKTFNKFKRTTYENAYNRAGEKVVDGIEHAIGDSARSLLDENLRGLKIAGQSFEKFNHNYGLLIQGRQILKSAIGKSQLSALSERLLGGALGYAFGATAGGVSGGAGALLGAGFGGKLIESLPITGIRSALGAAAQKVGDTRIPQSVSKLKQPITAVERVTENRDVDSPPE